MAVRYGVPYKGSKNAIAQWVVSRMPGRTNFYDLFAGGCAVTHYAMLTGRFRNFIINDIEDVPELFLDSMKGRFKDEKRWISRDDFFRLKDTEPYIRYCWSFGNNGRDYLYSKEVEPWKKALHYARAEGDLSLFKSYGIETDGTKADIIRNNEKYKNQYIVWYCRNVLKCTAGVPELLRNLEEDTERRSEELRNYLKGGLKKAGKSAADADRYLGTNGMARHYFSRSQWEFPTREAYIKLQAFLDLPLEYEEIYGLQKLKQSLQSLEKLQSLQVLRKSYDEIEIKPGSIIYCDIPYKGTDPYQESGFDYTKFYDWCERQAEPVFISEYWMPPDRFRCVAGTEKRVSLCAGSGRKAAEKIFVPECQIKSGITVIKNKYIQTEFEF